MTKQALHVSTTENYLLWERPEKILCSSPIFRVLRFSVFLHPHPQPNVQRSRMRKSTVVVNFHENTTQTGTGHIAGVDGDPKEEWLAGELSECHWSAAGWRWKSAPDKMTIERENGWCHFTGRRCFRLIKQESISTVRYIEWLMFTWLCECGIYLTVANPHPSTMALHHHCSGFLSPSLQWDRWD